MRVAVRATSLVIAWRLTNLPVAVVNTGDTAAPSKRCTGQSSMAAAAQLLALALDMQLGDRHSSRVGWTPSAPEVFVVPSVMPTDGVYEAARRMRAVPTSRSRSSHARPSTSLTRQP